MLLLETNTIPGAATDHSPFVVYELSLAVTCDEGSVTAGSCCIGSDELALGAADCVDCGVDEVEFPDLLHY